jgi:hypothetical protein
MGQNYGVIIEIGDGELKLKELLQDGAGDWTERSSSLQLQQQAEHRRRDRGEMMSAIHGIGLSRACAATRRGWATGLVALCALALSGMAMAQAQPSNSLDRSPSTADRPAKPSSDSS